jgi:hypothetical protein
MINATKKIISPSDELVLSLEVRQIPIYILQTLFKNNLVGSKLPIQTQRAKSNHAIADMFSATENLDLDLLLKVYSDFYIPPPRLQRADESTNLLPITPRKRLN